MPDFKTGFYDFLGGNDFCVETLEYSLQLFLAKSQVLVEAVFLEATPIFKIWGIEASFVWQKATRLLEAPPICDLSGNDPTICPQACGGWVTVEWQDCRVT